MSRRIMGKDMTRGYQERGRGRLCTYGGLACGAMRAGRQSETQQREHSKVPWANGWAQQVGKGAARGSAGQAAVVAAAALAWPHHSVLQLGAACQWDHACSHYPSYVVLAAQQERAAASSARRSAKSEAGCASSRQAPATRQGPAWALPG